MLIGYEKRCGFFVIWSFHGWTLNGQLEGHRRWEKSNLNISVSSIAYYGVYGARALLALSLAYRIRVPFVKILTWVLG